ncbi:TetR/AcrR family transcriptional regulator [Streptomyces pactum]|uniref:TetR/AcrR family transcriptional regulator n=1 Tax=Streptomyces pactum TaxID=68249 RepID=A0ABS0NQ83_9ACTN|nr:TetR/AcrR family transcriptional regulator [Streptomyces pactum]MBH5337365.1 TetR/AcrR family transcriptional regulator [Streptomyces pactum]
MVSSGRHATGAQPPAVRRRGPVLERAILSAALDQLSEVGWKGLTMEGVAAGAQTGKAAVYRRWSTKEDLVIDALRAGLPKPPDPPDHGSLRADLLSFCYSMLSSMRSRSGVAVRAVIHECDHGAAERIAELIKGEVLAPGKEIIRHIVRNGIARGEVRADACGGMIEDVVPALLMYRTKVCAGEVTDRDVTEIVDQVMLPMLRVHGA